MIKLEVRCALTVYQAIPFLIREQYSTTIKPHSMAVTTNTLPESSVPSHRTTKRHDKCTLTPQAGETAKPAILPNYPVLPFTTTTSQATKEVDNLTNPHWSYEGVEADLIALYPRPPTTPKKTKAAARTTPAQKAREMEMGLRFPSLQAPKWSEDDEYAGWTTKQLMEDYGLKLFQYRLRQDEEVEAKLRRLGLA